jgi:hypothetical protein
MKVFLAGLLIVSTTAFGQRAGGLRTGSGGFGHGRPAVTGARRGSFEGNRFGPRGFGPSYYPLGWSPYFGDEAYSYAPAPPNVIVVQPPSTTPEPAPTPAQPVIHEYNFNEAAAAPPPPVEQRAFVIALKDGSKASAVAFWVQERTLHYIDRDGNGRHVALSEVDRTLTQKLNREQQLPLSLPPG